MTSLVQPADWHQDYKVLELQDIRNDVDEAVIAIHRYTTTGEASYLEPDYDATDKIELEIAQLQQVLVDKPDQQHRLATFVSLINRKFAEIKQRINLRPTRGFEIRSQALMLQNEQSLQMILKQSFVSSKQRKIGY